MMILDRTSSVPYAVFWGCVFLDVFKNRLKDGRTVLIKELEIEDKEKLVEM